MFGFGKKRRAEAAEAAELERLTEGLIGSLKERSDPDHLSNVAAHAQNMIDARLNKAKGNKKEMHNLSLELQEWVYHSSAESVEEKMAGVLAASYLEAITLGPASDKTVAIIKRFLKEHFSEAVDSKDDPRDDPSESFARPTDSAEIVTKNAEAAGMFVAKLKNSVTNEEMHKEIGICSKTDALAMASDLAKQLSESGWEVSELIGPLTAEDPPRNWVVTYSNGQQEKLQGLTFDDATMHADEQGMIYGGWESLEPDE